MKLNDEEKKFLGFAHKLESQKCKDDLIFYAETMVRTQEAFKADYGFLPESYPAPQAQVRAGA